ALQPVERIAVHGTEVNSIQVTLGMCLRDAPAQDGSVGRVTVVPCAGRHQAEAVASYAFLAEEWPGAEAVREQVLDYCGQVVQPGRMFHVEDWERGLRWVAWAPTEHTWKEGDRTGLCVAYREAGLLGSFHSGT